MKHKFAAGDKVIMINDNGVKIRGEKSILAIDTSATGPRYLIAPSDTPWFSVPESQLSLVESPMKQTLKQRIDSILGRNCPALGNVSNEGISVIRELEQRVTRARSALRIMIDGGEECRGIDSEISHVIRILEGETV